MTGLPAPDKTGAVPRIAVAIACYNQGRFVEDAIRSVLGQTRPANEIILVDDGSTDATAEVARAYPQVRYRYQRNAGLSAARNTALAGTQAELILFLDADDLLCPSALAEAERCITGGPGLAFVYGGYLEVDRHRRVLSRQCARPTTTPFLDLLRGNFIAMHGTVLYNAKLLRASGGFDVGLKSCEDYDVFLRLARTSRIAAYDIAAAEYRRHEQGLTGNCFQMIATSRAVIRRHQRLADPDASHRAAAKTGFSFMTEHYAAKLIESLTKDRREHRLGRALGRVVRDAFLHPSAIPHVAGPLSELLRRVIVSRLRRR